jgi:hypothetical protein
MSNMTGRGDLYPDVYNNPGATFANLKKLGISMSATLADSAVVDLRGAEDLKLTLPSFDESHSWVNYAASPL